MRARLEQPALSCTPTVALMGRPNQETEATRAFHASLPPVIREGYEAMHASEHGLQQRSFPDNSDLYWIAFLATSPKAQGRGLAKALLSQLRGRAAKEGRTVALLTQTAENVSVHSMLLSRRGGPAAPAGGAPNCARADGGPSHVWAGRGLSYHHPSPSPKHRFAYAWSRSTRSWGL